MPYRVQFVGLVCFCRDEGVRWVLLPDGHNPGAGIDPHYPTLIVAADAIEKATGWSDEDVSAGVFRLPQCTIVLEGVDVPGTLDASDQDARLPRLKSIDPNFEIDLDRAQTSARLQIRRGVLTAYTIPGGSALISQLEVPHDGSITIAVKPTDGSAPRTLRLRAETELIIGNMAERGVYEQTGHHVDRHFQIYEKLSLRPVSLPELVTDDLAGSPRSPSRHWYFTRRVPINLNTSCSNTGYP